MSPAATGAIRGGGDGNGDCGVAVAASHIRKRGSHTGGGAKAEVVKVLHQRSGVKGRGR